MRLDDAGDLGRYVRERRMAADLTQVDLARQAGVSRRWLLELEGGKATAELGLIFKVIAALGLRLEVRPASSDDIDLDAYLDSLGGPA
ncbi:helix-turn-helix domain-containing protein [Paractinoplanes atraurantiacus]|uniref:Transcriptional regulator, y4mF family n=1 Tax=Paractinoplanes atraurantiacus TaxID=1036182 RepID=A0A285KJ37_9ACTN|nr:helix-turn-helix domain-containing protein [Actinoplanes atraurantiacus]SNY72615.1 transcriptional regulator, y4mF family [Actinoplanes atraurantiacus]